MRCFIGSILGVAYSSLASKKAQRRRCGWCSYQASACCQHNRPLAKTETEQAGDLVISGRVSDNGRAGTRYLVSWVQKMTVARNGSSGPRSFVSPAGIESPWLEADLTSGLTGDEG